MTKGTEEVLMNIDGHKKWVFQRIGDSEDLKIERIPSGSVGLDYALGGGWPRGRYAEIFGTPGCGKTLLSFFAIAEVQRMGGKAAFLDLEAALDPDWAAGNGVDIKNLYLYQPSVNKDGEVESGEDVLDKLISAIKLNQYDIIVLDSIAALVPRVILAGEVGDVTIGAHARLMSRGLSMLTPALAQSKTACIFINQIRVNPMQMFGNPEQTTGGRALNYYASIRAEVRKESKSEKLNDLKEPIGHTVNVTITKNKVAPPLRKAKVPILYASGVIKDEDFINAAQARGLIVWDGGVKYKGERVPALKDARWKSFDVFTEWLKNPETDQAVVAALKQEIAEC